MKNDFPVNGSYRLVLCHACRTVANCQVYLNGDWARTEIYVELVNINKLWVCDTDACKRKAKLKAFW